MIRRKVSKGDSCLAAVFVGAGQPLELRRVALPELQDGEALVRVDCCTLCGSDRHTITGARREQVPSILGHEALGVVVQVTDPPPVDAAGKPLRLGDRVTWSLSVSCGSCDRCAGGLPQKCRSLFKYGHELASGRTTLSGGLAEFILLQPGTTIVRLGSELSDRAACPANCAGATVAAAYRAAGTVEGKAVLILGAGMLGLTAAAFARTRGATSIVICDPLQHRLSRACHFGADNTVQWHNGGKDATTLLRGGNGTRLFDVILELSGSPDAVEVAVELAALGAKIVLVGSVMTSRPVRLDPEQLVRRCVSICGVHNYAPQDLCTAVDFLRHHHMQFPFEDLVEQTYSLDRVNEAVQAAIAARPFRVAIRPAGVQE